MCAYCMSFAFFLACKYLVETVLVVVVHGDNIEHRISLPKKP